MLILFRSKTKFRNRTYSNNCNNDFGVYKSVHNFHNEQKVNFHMISLIFVLITGLYGKWILLAYGISCILAAMIFYYKNIKHELHKKINSLKKAFIKKLKQMKHCFTLAINQVDRIEQEFLKLNNISATVSQIVFFTICEKVLIPDQNVTALYSLMFYNVIGYCVSYMRQMIGQTNWSPYINVASHSSIKHLAMSATKIVLEITKATTFIITIVFMLFVLCLEQRMHHYQPNKCFTVLTFAYYLATEKMFADVFPAVLAYFQIAHLENLESLWAPVLLSVTAQSLSFGFASALFVRGVYRGAFVAFYLNVYLSYKKLKQGSLRVLNEEKELVSPFRYATKQELEEFEDVCAVCLNEMSLARVTPCHHIFHTDCLRQCLLTCDKCPVCKRELKFS